MTTHRRHRPQRTPLRSTTRQRLQRIVVALQQGPLTYDELLCTVGTRATYQMENDLAMLERLGVLLEEDGTRISIYKCDGVSL